MAPAAVRRPPAQQPNPFSHGCCQHSCRGGVKGLMRLAMQNHWQYSTSVRLLTDSVCVSRPQHPLCARRRSGSRSSSRPSCRSSSSGEQHGAGILLLLCQACFRASAAAMPAACQHASHRLRTHAAALPFYCLTASQRSLTACRVIRFLGNIPVVVPLRPTPSTAIRRRYRCAASIRSAVIRTPEPAMVATGPGLFTSSKPEDRRVVPDEPVTTSATAPPAAPPSP